MEKRNQQRGNCQCCGRRQAVLDTGLMSKHGYTVDNGWFNGVCNGQRHQPMQKDRTHTDAVIEHVRNECHTLDLIVAKLRNGKQHPARVEKAYYRRGEDQMVDWADASDEERKRGVQVMIFKTENRIRAGRSFADQMESLADAVHGQPLYEIEVEKGPMPIQIGERRKAPNGKILSVVRLQGARVYWKDERGYGSWTGSSAWRKYEIV